MAWQIRNTFIPPHSSLNHSFLTMNYLLTFLVILIAQTNCSVVAFLSGYHRDITTTTFATRTRTSSKVVSTRLALANEKEVTSTGIELSTLRELTDHDAEGQRIARSITGWLDEEVS